MNENKFIEILKNFKFKCIKNNIEATICQYYDIKHDYLKWLYDNKIIPTNSSLYNLLGKISESYDHEENQTSETLSHILQEIDSQDNLSDKTQIDKVIEEILHVYSEDPQKVYINFKSFGIRILDQQFIDISNNKDTESLLISSQIMKGFQNNRQMDMYFKKNLLSIYTLNNKRKRDIKNKQEGNCIDNNLLVNNPILLDIQTHYNLELIKCEKCKDKSNKSIEERDCRYCKKKFRTILRQQLHMKSLILTKLQQKGYCCIEITDILEMEYSMAQKMIFNLKNFDNIGNVYSQQYRLDITRPSTMVTREHIYVIENMLREHIDTNELSCKQLAVHIRNKLIEKHALPICVSLSTIAGQIRTLNHEYMLSIKTVNETYEDVMNINK